MPTKLKVGNRRRGKILHNNGFALVEIRFIGFGERPENELLWEITRVEKNHGQVTYAKGRTVEGKNIIIFSVGQSWEVIEKFDDKISE